MKKRILIIDPLSYSGHVNYNYGIIRCLENCYDIGIVVNRKTAESLRQKGVDKKDFVYQYPDEWNISFLSKRMGKLLYHIMFRLYFLIVIFKTMRIAKKFDKILFTCIDVYAFMFISWFIKKDCYVVDHGIGNILYSKSYKCAWNSVPHKIHLIVLEPFIKEMVAQELKHRDIFVVRHPLPVFKKQKPKLIDKSDCVTLFAPGGGNFDLFVNQLKKVEIPRNLKIIVKGNAEEYKTDNLLIYKGHLSNEVYESYLKSAKFILLPYDPSYNYRVSAVLFEAIVNNKPVMILSNNTLKKYKEIFPGMVCLFNSVEEMFLLSENFKPHSENPSLDFYSDENISQSLYTILN